MNNLLLFRDNETDFFRWCSHGVRWARTIVNNMEKNKDWLSWYNNRDDYEDALKVMQQYTVLKASLDIELQMYLDFVLIDGDNQNSNLSYMKEIFRNWEEICFHRKHPKIRDLDGFMLGHRLREQRILSGLTTAKVAGILRISSKSLYAYEEGTRKISADILYRLSQIYNVSMDELVSLSERRKKS